MIEEKIIEYLSSLLSVPVFLEIPEHPPKSYVALDRTGGDMTDRLKHAVFAVQSYAPSLAAAAALNEEVKQAFENAEFTAILNSDYNYTDTTKKEYRYQAIFEFYY